MRRLLEEVAQDLRFALRGLRRAPGFGALAVASLAVGIGATTAIFSVVDATLLRPLPFREPERLVKLVLRMPREAGVRIDMSWSYPKFLAFVREQRVLSAAGLYIHQSVTVGGGEGGERVPGEAVTARYLDVLGVRPIYGTGITWADDGAGPAPSVLLGHDYWRRRFAADLGVVGRTIEVDGRALTVAGILPRGFRGLTGRADVWLPVPTARAGSMAQAGAHQYEMVARLRPGVSLGQAKDETRALGARLAEAYPSPGEPWGAAAYALEEVRVDPGVRRAVVVVAGAVALLLLITCANLAGLLLARGAARRREVAIRRAVGAPYARLVRQLLVESLALAGLGALAGLVVAWAGVRALSVIAPAAAGEFSGAFAEDVSGLTRLGLQSARIDGAALAFTAGVAVLAGLLFGLAPALRNSRADLAAAMKAGVPAEPGFAGLRRLTARGALVAVETALAVVLLVGAGLLLRSLSELLRVPPGFVPERVLTARLSLSSARLDAAGGGDRAATVSALWGDLLERAAALPGVEAVGVATCAPVSTECEGTSLGIGPDDQVPVELHGASPGYFATLRIPLLAGRVFTAADRRWAPRVIVVNRAAVETYWGGTPPVGRRVLFWGDTAEIVGVVGDVRYDRLEERPRPAIYLPFAQRPFASAMMFVRTTREPSALAAALRNEVRRLDPGHAVYDVKPMHDRLLDAAARTRFTAVALAAFAGSALVLAVIGIYGVVSLAVAQRMRELGIRMAVGASGARVVGMVLGQGLTLAGLGCVLGVALAAASTRMLGAVLFGVRPLDPATFGAIVALLGVVALGAAYVPARRAARVSVMDAIRAE